MPLDQRILEPSLQSGQRMTILKAGASSTWVSMQKSVMGNTLPEILEQLLRSQEHSEMVLNLVCLHQTLMSAPKNLVKEVLIKEYFFLYRLISYPNNTGKAMEDFYGEI